MMPKDCSGTAPDGMVCVECGSKPTAVIRGWPVCDDSYCKYWCWHYSGVGPVKIAADSTTDKDGD